MVTGNRGSSHVSDESRSVFSWPLGAVLLGLIGLAVAIAMVNQPEFTGDPAIYRDRMSDLFSGGLPYLDFDFEHFPLSALPMVLAWALGGSTGAGAYTVVFAVLMAGCLVITTVFLSRIEATAGGEAIASRWLAMAGPLFPIVLFRSDPFTVLLGVGALHSIARGLEQRAFKFELAGALAKGWPVLYAIPEWSRGQRVKALLLGGITSLVVAFLVSVPGFNQTRSFSGLHSESVVGAMFIALRRLGGEPLELLYEAGATYVTVPIWGWLLSVNIGLAVGLLAFARSRKASTFEDVPRIIAVSLLALLLISPLLSPQFLIWAVPFVVFFRSRTVFTLGMWVTGLTLVYMSGWNPDFVGEPWWIYLLNARNAALVVLGGLCAWKLGEPTVAQSQSQGVHAR